MIEACREIDGNTLWYVFGSVLQNQASPSDIDVLCISSDTSTLRKVRSRCADFLLNAPIHLRILTERQEQALEFIERTGAVNISQK
ncbi:nucleotidyltransferase domain-containing protein [Hoeflea sp.]|uniref:nucleotidyltransferase domain-containing protein n=1 Tax=Hoeflea sp. TaxID=1940281 RepID=UPI003B026FA0